MGHVAASELPSQEGRALSRGTRGSTGAPLSGRQNTEPWDTWQCRSSPQQGGEVWDRETRGGAGGHLCREVRSGAGGPWQRRSSPQQGGEVQGHRTHAWRRSSPQQGGEVQGCETHGGAEAHLCKEVRFGAEGHVAASELTSARR
jgi:hypothetical protein